jgi:hypothetical protein
MDLYSPELFSALVKAASFEGKTERLTPLTNMTFFLGAGFSKSWNNKFPTGYDLFNFKAGDYSDDLSEFVLNIGFPEELDYSLFRDMSYYLSMQKKYSVLKSRYLDSYNINKIENEINYVISKRFDSLCKLNYLNTPNEKMKFDNINEEQKNILQFFSWIHKQTTGENVIPEGLRPHFITTNYDFLIESILDMIIGMDDSYSFYTYRGISPDTINNIKPPTIMYNHWLVNSLIKINGGFEIFKSSNGYNLDYTVKSEDDLKKQAPTLILPNREQDYTGSYFQEIFPKAVRTLHESKILVIVGYSLPEEDALIRLLIRQFAEENVDLTEKFIFYISTSDEEEQYEKLHSVYPYLNGRLKERIITYSGTFNSWLKEVLKFAK